MEGWWGDRRKGESVRWKRCSGTPGAGRAALAAHTGFTAHRCKRQAWMVFVTSVVSYDAPGSVAAGTPNVRSTMIEIKQKLYRVIDCIGLVSPGASLHRAWPQQGLPIRRAAGSLARGQWREPAENRQSNARSRGHPCCRVAGPCCTLGRLHMHARQQLLLSSARALRTPRLGRRAGF